MEITIATPSDFNFKRTVLSHGWSGLLPFERDEENWRLTAVLDVGLARPVTFSATDGRGHIRATTSARLSARAAERATRHLRHVFRLDDDMAPFYTLMSSEDAFTWISTNGAGRMLRSSTVFEDLVKTICTTNCSWALTKIMATALVQKLGTQSNDGRKGFPGAEVMAEQSEEFYRQEIRAGYRAGYLKELAQRVASGELDVESWLSSDLPTAELKKQMKQVKGVGDYAAENLLKLLGRYDGLALDSWLRSQFAKTHNNGRAATDKKIERHYSRFGEWRGLALWCDM